MDASQGPFVLPEVWTEISTQLDDAEMLLTLADISKTVRKGLAARPGMYLVATQEELDVALDAADAHYIFLVRPGLTVHKNPADAQNAIVATRRGGMNVTGGELYLLGEDASVSASVSGGVAYAHGQAALVGGSSMGVAIVDGAGPVGSILAPLPWRERRRDGHTYNLEWGQCVHRRERWHIRSVIAYNTGSSGTVNVSGAG